MGPWLATLLACGSSSIREDTRRLDGVSGVGFAVEPTATMRAWHHAAGPSGEWGWGWTPRHDTAMVHADLVVRRGERWLRNVGDGGVTTRFEADCPGGFGHGDAVAQARTMFEQLAFEACDAPDRFAWRLGTPAVGGAWRVAVVRHDRVVYGFAAAEAATCAEALAGLPAADVWIRDRARGSVCSGLEDVDPVNALRCKMREQDPRELGGVGSRGTPDLEGLDASRVVEALDPVRADTTAFAPYRVRAAIDHVADPLGLEPLQARLEAHCQGPCLPWELVAIGRIAGRRGDRDACRRLLATLEPRMLARDLVGVGAVLSGATGCGVDDELGSVMQAAWERDEPPLDSEAMWACPPEHAVAGLTCVALADQATAWVAATCDPRGVHLARIAVDREGTAPGVTQDRARAILSACGG